MTCKPEETKLIHRTASIVRIGLVLGALSLPAAAEQSRFPVEWPDGALLEERLERLREALVHGTRNTATSTPT